MSVLKSAVGWLCLETVNDLAWQLLRKRKVKGLEWAKGAVAGGATGIQYSSHYSKTTVFGLLQLHFTMTHQRFPCNYSWTRCGQQPSTSPWPYAHRIFPVSEHLTAASSFSGSCQRRWGLCLLLFLVLEWMVLAQAAWV